MDVKAWMRDLLAEAAFAPVEVKDVKPAELARATRTALRLPRDQAQECMRWAEEVLAEARPLRPHAPPQAAPHGAQDPAHEIQRMHERITALERLREILRSARGDEDAAISWLRECGYEVSEPSC